MAYGEKFKMLTKATFRRSTERACAHEDQVLGAARISCHHVLSQAAPRHHPPIRAHDPAILLLNSGRLRFVGPERALPGWCLGSGTLRRTLTAGDSVYAFASYLVHEEQEQASEMLERAAREVAKASEEDARPVRL